MCELAVSLVPNDKFGQRLVTDTGKYYHIIEIGYHENLSWLTKINNVFES